MLRGDNTEAESLSKLSELCIEYGHPKSLHSFYMLHFALMDLNAGRQTFYWVDANADNVYQIIRTAAHKYLADSQGAAEPGAAGDTP